jgi:predicted NUDIX family NTP pyrophosphohydrolase
MRRLSAGLVMFRRGKFGVEVFLVRPGGPLWRKKDLGGWSIPKGEVLAGEDDFDGGTPRIRRRDGDKARRGIC